MFNNYYFYIYQKENKTWAWNIQLSGVPGSKPRIIGSSTIDYSSYQDVINDLVKIVKINKWEKEEPNLYRVMLEFKEK